LKDNHLIATRAVEAIDRHVPTSLTIVIGLHTKKITCRTRCYREATNSKKVRRHITPILNGSLHYDIRPLELARRQASCSICFSIAGAAKEVPGGSTTRRTECAM